VSPQVFIDWASMLALGMVALALLLSLTRIVIGPTLADRVLGLDLLTIVVMGFVGVIAVRTGLMLYLEIAIAIALMGFLATIALARYILLRAGGRRGM